MERRKTEETRARSSAHWGFFFVKKTAPVRVRVCAVIDEDLPRPREMGDARAPWYLTTLQRPEQINFGLWTAPVGHLPLSTPENKGSRF
jgi:hypothetical protein